MMSGSLPEWKARMTATRSSRSCLPSPWARERCARNDQASRAAWAPAQRTAHARGAAAARRRRKWRHRAAAAAAAGSPLAEAQSVAPAQESARNRVCDSSSF
eukprot:2781588-Pleurochrysis_carterae.AAC.1